MPDGPSLADLVADAKQMQLARLPRPRTQSATPRPAIDLTGYEITLPEATRSLVEAFEAYGS